IWSAILQRSSHSARRAWWPPSSLKLILSIELILYGFMLLAVSRSWRCDAVCCFRKARSFDAQISKQSNPLSLAARMSVSRSAFIVVAPLRAINMLGILRRAFQITKLIGDEE